MITLKAQQERVLMRLREFRVKRKWTQGKLAEVVGVTREYITRIETGKHDPHLSLLLRLARALGVKPSKLLD